MARGVNKVILIGNLGDEPSFRTTNSGTAVVNISMVTNEMRRNIETGQQTELAEWHRVVMWGKLAEIAHQWLHKGSQIYIEGKLRTRSYTDKQNIKRTITEIVADEMQMLGSKNSAAQASDSYDQSSNNIMQNSNNQYQANAYQPSEPNAYGSSRPVYGSECQTGYASNSNQGTDIYGGQAAYNNQNPYQNQGAMQEPNSFANTTTVDGELNDDLPF